MNIRLLIADDHQVIREGLRARLMKVRGITILEEATGGNAAVKLALKLIPDVVLMDIAMPDLDGIEATRRITSAQPGIRVIGLSMYSDPEFVEKILGAGASGYLIKDHAGEELIHAVHAVLDGIYYIGRGIPLYFARRYHGRIEEEKGS